LTDGARPSGPLAPLVAEDLYNYSWVSDPQLSPDGRWVLYVLTKPEKQGKKYNSEVWRVDVSAAGAAGGDSRPPVTKRFTGGPRDRAARWSPDGSQIAFISDRSEGAQIWLIPNSGGEARQLTKLKGGIAGEPVWSSDGTQLAFIRRVGAQDTLQPGGNSGDGGAEPPEAPKSDVKAYTRLKYKENGRGLWDGKYAQVFVVSREGGEPRQVTFGPYDHSGPAWSPCGEYIGVAANRSADPDRTPSSDIWVVPARGGDPRRITQSEGPAMQPAWSPDGRLIAYYGHRNEFRGATLTHIWVAASDGSGCPVDILADWDGEIGISSGSDMMTSSMGAPAWTPDGQYVLFQASERGAVNLYKARVSTPASTYGNSKLPAVPGRVTSGKHTIYAVSFARDRAGAAVALATPANPGDIHLYHAFGPAVMPSPACCADASGPAPVRLTDVNGWLRERTVVAPEEFVCQGPDGGEIHGWLLRPAGFAEGTKYPLVVEIHGGPQTAYGWAFVHEFQLLAGRGMGVMYSNPGGSTGYGQHFATLTHHDWGGRDYRDVMAATEHAAAQTWVDADRLGVTGGSYGGYMTNWIVGQTNRFRAAVTQRSTCNRYSMFGTSDIGYYNGDFQFRGNPWENADFYLERSPLTYVNNIETPVLIIHSEQDLRCPIEQGEQLYTALRWLGKTAEFVRFPDENHELSRSGQPVHRVERLTRIADWFIKYLAAEPQE